MVMGNNLLGMGRNGNGLRETGRERSFLRAGVVTLFQYFVTK